MAESIVLKHCHDHGDGYTVVRSERSFVRRQHIAVKPQLQPVFFEIDVTVGCFFADHIKVTLKHHGRMLLIPL